MRAAMISLRIRLGAEHPMVVALNEAQDHFQEAYLATGPALTERKTGAEAVAPAFDAVERYKDACDVALSIAHERFANPQMTA